MSVSLTIQKVVAAASFVVAAALAFTALLISEEHEIEAGVCMVIAQFLTLCATIFGVDYKFTSRYGTSTSSRDSKQQSA